MFEVLVSTQIGEVYFRVIPSSNPSLVDVFWAKGDDRGMFNLFGETFLYSLRNVVWSL